jgi:hypothetical protein
MYFLDTVDLIDQLQSASNQGKLKRYIRLGIISETIYVDGVKYQVDTHKNVLYRIENNVKILIHSF